ncbi:hypothetical protein [Streptomyces sp. XD-27]|uniref:hypothetical protein n=1 Tax=Streptomyces sp. XD-27 TaxID=3062779 RepID=UPI0026F41B13|nr:hypothetical protein [Streptomyces sp. XD-27]WKX69773.1 hypothetical protein Q3Y56_07480 [Streptomyces sp. XD-27]
MNEELTTALKPVLRDLSATCAVQPKVTEEVYHGEEHIVLYERDGSGTGIGLWLGRNHAERIAHIADQIQDWAVEALCAALKPAVWPECPTHPDSHPLQPEVKGGIAVWSCPHTRQTVSLIGELPRPRPRVESEGRERGPRRKRERRRARE